MPKPTVVLGFVALASSILVLRLAPEFAIRDSLTRTALSIFAFECFCYFVYYVILYPRLFSPLRKYPTVPGGNIIFGQFVRAMREPAGEPHKEWIKSVPNDGILVYHFAFNQERIMPTTPKAVGEVLVQRSYDFIKPAQLREGLARLLGVGLLLAEGDEHKRQRKNLMPAFAFRHIKDLYPIFWSKTREGMNAMVEFLKSSGSGNLEIGLWSSRITLDIIGVAGLGRDFGSIHDPKNDLNRTYQTMFNPNRQARIMQVLGFIIPTWILRALPVKRNEEFVNAVRTIRSVAEELVVNKKRVLSGSERTNSDILSVAMESGGFSDDDLANQLMTFLAAGHETTASAVMWVAYLLSEHQDVQTRLREEIRANLPSISDASSVISPPDIDRMTYLHAVCNEVLRLYPPVPVTLRVTAQDTSIVGNPIAKGTTVVLPIWAFNTHTEFWGPDAAEFNPSRWIGPGRANTGGADSNYSYMTFLHGPRSCIGSGFAKAEFAIIVAGLVGRFEFSLRDPQYKLDIQGGVTSKPKGGLDLNIKAIEGW